jgi:hypothetical protein
MATWGEKGRQLSKQLEGVIDESAIKKLAIATLKDIYQLPTADTRANAIKQINRELNKVFPRRESEIAGYWHDPKGKEAQPKWRHLIFKHLTLSTEDWDKAGTETRKGAREEWKATQPTEQPTEQPAEQPAEQPTEQPAEQVAQQATEQPKKQRKPRQPKQPKQPKQTLKTMTIEQLELDTDTQAILTNALEHSGMALEDFIKQAIKVYAKTVTGKAKQTSEDLSNISTQDLLNNPKYSTHPSRAEELTKRAIRAIKFFNANKATENADRWMITQSAIASLTGSRQGTIKQLLEQFKDDVDSHNQTYGLNAYSNRKPGKDITEIINLPELVPNGVD